MLSLPIAFRRAIGGFAPVFSRPVWQHATVLMPGAVLAPGTRTVTAMLRIRGRRAEADFQTSHRVLHRAVWSPLKASRRLLRLIVAVCIPRSVIVFGLDDTLERRRGEQSTAQGISRDPVRSSHTHFIKGSGLRWLACLVLAPLSWADRVWALPFRTVVCPSERCSAQRGRRHQPLTERAWQMRRLGGRWLPGREIVFVADSRFAVLELLNKVKTWPHGSVLTRLRLDAALSDPPPPRAPGTPGRPRLKGRRRPTLEAVLTAERTPWSTMIVAQWYGAGPREVEIATDTAVGSPTGKPPVAIRWLLIRAPHERFTPQALLSTDLEHTPAQMLRWFVRRWTMAVPFEEARAHLGMATQRQGNERASASTTPALLSLYTILTRTTQLLIEQGATCGRSTAWYRKTRPPFSDAMALVRRQVWEHLHFSMSPQETDMIQIPRVLLERFTEALCYAA
jgi:hypothetical protein